MIGLNLDSHSTRLNIFLIERSNLIGTRWEILGVVKVVVVTVGEEDDDILWLDQVINGVCFIELCYHEKLTITT